jgi:hypothetical protein
MSELLRALPLVDEELVAYLQERGSSNNLYYLAEVIASTAAVTATSAADISQGLSAFTEEMLRVTNAFTAAADAIIGAFIQRHPTVSRGSLVEVELPKITPTLEIHLPWFTDPAGLDRSAA